MNERFTDKSRKVLEIANEEALSRGQDTIALEYLLYGLIKEGSGVAAQILPELDIDFEDLKNHLEKNFPSKVEHLAQIRLPLDSQTQAAIEYAEQQAYQWRQNYVGTEHLLIGISRELLLPELQQIGIEGNENLIPFHFEELHETISLFLGFSIIGESFVPKHLKEMYENFSERALKVMQQANHEAQRFNHEYLGTEHLLMGLAKEGTGVAATVLKSLGLDIRTIRIEAEKIVKPGPNMVTLGTLPKTGRCKNVLKLANEEKVSASSSQVDTQHLLLGLMREPEAVAVEIIKNQGFTPETIREETRKQISIREGHKP